eukprot:scaffold674_cov119-Isochrysis_galbana.AAC.2
MHATLFTATATQHAPSTHRRHRTCPARHNSQKPTLTPRPSTPACGRYASTRSLESGCPLQPEPVGHV